MGYTAGVKSERVVPRKVLEYLTPDGRSPFHVWLRSLKDARAIAAIRQRLNRARLGNLGFWAPVGEGVCELKIAYGPGYRVYFAEDGGAIVILLCGGDKGTQRADIQRAKVYWREYRSLGHAETNPKL